MGCGTSKIARELKYSLPRRSIELPAPHVSSPRTPYVLVEGASFIRRRSCGDSRNPKDCWVGGTGKKHSAIYIRIKSRTPSRREIKEQSERKVVLGIGYGVRRHSK